MLDIDQVGRVRRVTLHRPDVLNAFDTAQYDRCAEAFRTADNDDSVAVLVLTGRGRAFSAGQDLTEMSRLADAHTAGDGAASGFPSFVDAVVSFSKPLVVAVNGLGLGIGFTLLAHADIALMARSAKLRTPFTSLGVAPEAASSVLFPQLVGWQNAAWVLLSSEWIDAETALSMGFVREICEDDALQERALHIAAAIAKWPISSLRATKGAMTAARGDLVAAARAREDAAFESLLGSAANTEALTAFLERRDPDFGAIPGE